MSKNDPATTAERTGSNTEIQYFMVGVMKFYRMLRNSQLVAYLKAEIGK